jgi:AraC-like DNA-binding protein
MKICRVNYGHVENPLFEESLEFNAVVPHSVRKKKFEKAEYVPLHYADTLEILLAENLEGQIMVDQYHFTDLKNSAFLIPPNTIHSTNIQKCMGTLYTIKLSFKELSYYLDVRHLLEFEKKQVETLPYACCEFEELKVVAEELITNDKNIYKRMKAIISLVEVLSKATAKIPCGEACRDNTDKEAVLDLRDIINWTKQNYQKQVTLDDAVKVSGFSKSYFCSQFKKTTGVTFMKYLNQVRVTQAKLMLNRGGSITNIAFECGFETPSYFSQVFKQETTFTPRQYRNICKMIKS